MGAAPIPSGAVLIAENVGVDQGNPAHGATLRARPGGHSVRSVQNRVVVVARSDVISTRMTVQATTEHGVDGAHLVEHTAAATTVTVNGDPITVGLDPDSTKPLGEFLRIEPSSYSLAGSRWCRVDVYELRRPF